jgi:hypothetical protein
LSEVKSDIAVADADAVVCKIKSPSAAGLFSGKVTKDITTPGSRWDTSVSLPFPILIAIPPMLLRLHQERKHKS